MSGHTIKATVIIGDYSAKVSLDVDAEYYGGRRQTWQEPGEPSGHIVNSAELGDDFDDLYTAISCYLNDQRAERIAEAMEYRADAEREERILRGES